ncbi:hypothetical protein LTR28_001453, partial [Elasticomyces elasticus]
MPTIMEGEIGLQQASTTLGPVDLGDPSLYDYGFEIESLDGMMVPADVTEFDTFAAQNELSASFGDFGVTQPIPSAADDQRTASFTDFASWIPSFKMPEVPCDYCRSKHLECFIRADKASCSACSNLFRKCSFVKEDAEEFPAGYHKLDTLYPVNEDVQECHGQLTGFKPMISRGPASRSGSADRGRKAAPRFPRAAVKILRVWLDAHSEHPYPTDEEKDDLQKRTGLKVLQVMNWLANARRRDKVRPKRCISPSLCSTSIAVDVPRTNNIRPWDDLNPLERWQHSPPENEPASVSAIADAVASSGLESFNEVPSPFSLGGKPLGSSGTSSASLLKAASTTSFETGQSSSSAASMVSTGNESSVDAADRCHPEWMCTPVGPIVTDTSDGSTTCAYCGASNPTPDHIETHNHAQCEEKGRGARTFYRKDHLRQHLRLMHGCTMIPSMDAWNSTISNINSRCGFCRECFTSWTDRTDHLAAHFKTGALMKDWKGCRGLDPAVAAQVTNVMPAYLIGPEAASMNPFSATNEGSRQSCIVPTEVATGCRREDLVMQHDPLKPSGIDNAPSLTDILPTEEASSAGILTTYWEILTVSLGHFARKMCEEGVVLSDELLQQTARNIVYGSDDPWNQTAADNPEWLELFKKAHGLDFIPATIGGTGPNIPEDVETYADLGLRVPFCVQLRWKNAMALDGAPGGVETGHDGNGDFASGQVESGLVFSGDDASRHRSSQEALQPIEAGYAGYSTLRLPPEKEAMFASVDYSLGTASFTNTDTTRTAAPSDPTLGTQPDASYEPALEDAVF